VDRIGLGDLTLEADVPVVAAADDGNGFHLSFDLTTFEKLEATEFGKDDGAATDLHSLRKAESVAVATSFELGKAFSLKALLKGTGEVPRWTIGP